MSLNWRTTPTALWRTARQQDRRRRLGDAPYFSWRPSDPMALFRPQISAPVFVVGAPRTGTTFIGECLARIRNTSYHYEPHVLQSAMRMYYVGEWDEDRFKHFLLFVYGWLLRQRMAGQARLIDKTPTNVFVIDALRRIFPDAKFVLMLRDGRDGAVSLAERPWHRATWGFTRTRGSTGEMQGPFAPFYIEAHRRDEFERTSDLHRAVWVWRRHTEAGLDAAERLGPSCCLPVRYEDLVRDAHGQAERLLEFLDVAEPASRQAFTAHLIGMRPSSVGRWKDLLTQEEVDLVQREGGGLIG